MDERRTKKHSHAVLNQMEYESLRILSNQSLDSVLLPFKAKLAIFDLDDTLITVKSDARFSTDSDDWEYKYESVPNILNWLEESGYFLVIITNQLGISKGYTDYKQFLIMIQKFLDKTGVKAVILAATEDDEYRKPFIGAFNHFFTLFESVRKRSGSSSPLAKRPLLNLMKESNSSSGSGARKQTRRASQDLIKQTPEVHFEPFYITWDKSRPFGLRNDLHNCSFYCGDAAGRITEDRNDFSNSDALFALNTNINFMVPEQLFTQKKILPLLDVPSFPFKSQVCKNKTQLLDGVKLEIPPKYSKKNMLILLVGPPGCGKTHFCHTHLSEFRIISYVR